MARLFTIGVLIATTVLGACSGKDGLRCEDPAQYAASGSIPPIRVPDDLTVPDESASLLVPNVPGAPDAEPPEGCLESPPDYFQTETPR